MGAANWPCDAATLLSATMSAPPPDLAPPALCTGTTPSSSPELFRSADLCIGTP